ncbi:MAG: excinuclease ABC subunit B, partial [Nitrospina sp.]|nr:excinuclease ABC subunit B [Nitrospina sp.]
SRRRKIQLEYNKAHNITPASIKKSIQDSMEYKEADEMALAVAEEEEIYESGVSVLELIPKLEKQMLAAAKNLEFEKAAELRDRIKRMRANDLKIIAG